MYNVGRILFGCVTGNGAVFSQFPPGTRPRPEYFPRRNALMSAWSEKGNQSSYLRHAWSGGKGSGRHIDHNRICRDRFH